MITNFDKLEDTKHMLEWFSNNPFKEITTTIEQLFIKQEPNTKMLSFEITSNPEWLTGGKKSENNDTVILVRSGVAVSCNFTLQNNKDVYHLKGIFTWVGVHLNTTPITNMWMDIDGTLDEFGKEGKLKERIYELDS
ncbi:hypothetical protein H1R17_11075 [Flavobacterium sp. xlx-214]|uniref:hypothetical protein n=1 Tax=unclassified Flavobacterium TaxID=196869 RepID=UPI0013D0B4FC|nr:MULTISPECIES: hypothetical protein [unclassified Flavobacterium]MBA5791756.1 hypothetical protein [Flavobacterium sp. xlx-221]QMI82995.1 hypothetical protein H1R17_11075 [Flavobacterium sp. xlx-214]